jgi:hypothetical protein
MRTTDGGPAADLRAIVLRHEQELRRMDHEMAMAFAADGRILLVKRGDPRSVLFDDQEVQRMFGAAVFTHNHPGDRSFSEADVALACALEWEEVRAVGPTWTHVLRPGSAGWNDRYWIDRLREECLRSQMYVGDDLQRAFARRRVTPQEADAEFWHLVWERTAESEGLEYDRYSGDRIDAD